MSVESERLQALIRAEQDQWAPDPAAVAHTYARLEGSIAQGLPPPFDLAPGAVPSTLVAVPLGAAGLAVGGVAVLLAAGAWWMMAVPELSPPPRPSPLPAPTESSTTATVSVAPVPAPSPTPAAPPVRRAPQKPVVRAAPPLVEPVLAPPPAPAAPAGLSEELALLRRAQMGLKRGVPGLALTALDEHQRRFPQGQMAEDVAALRAITLCRLGRAEGPAVARAFLQAHPSSPQAGRVARECAVD